MFVYKNQLLFVGFDEGKGQALLVLVLAALVGVAGAAHGVGAQEEDLGDALVGVDLGRQRRRVADLDGHLAAPLRLQGRYVDNYAATRVSAFPQTDCEHVPWDLERLDR